MTEDCTCATSRFVTSLVLSLERPSGHAGEGGGRSNFDERLKSWTVKEVLDFDVNLSGDILTGEMGYGGDGPENSV